jgi:hypothetical protein
LSRLGSTNTMLCQVPSATLQSTTGIVSDGEMKAGIT